MPTIRFDNLVCQQTQDIDGTDEAFLAFFRDGEYIGNIFREMRSNQQLAFGFDLEYTDSLRVQLWEIDDPTLGDPHDFIGEIDLDAAAQSGETVLSRSGARYTLSWTIAPAAAADPQLQLAVRRDQSTMSAEERTRFLDGITQLITDGTWGQLVVDHAGPESTFPFLNHGFVEPRTVSTQRFLPWHRVYLRRLEENLQQIDARIFLPYWRGWADRAIPQWLEGFTPNVPLPNNGIVGQPNPLPVTRGPAGTSFPSRGQVINELSSTDFTTMTTALEGGSHGDVHVAVGGTMRNASIASADVLFWMHHCEIDRLWSLWQAVRQGRPLLNGPNRQMTPWAEDVSQVLDHEDFGYVYT